MCGIVGVISSQPVDMVLVKQMNDKLIHRGPDGYGYLCSREAVNVEAVDQVVKLSQPHDIHFAFAHRRLAIHDLSQAGHQPMSYLDKYWLTFNGEIYNFIELRTELEENGYTFCSRTDSEVILAAYDLWGVNCLNKFNGDWALALLDTTNRSILISRDRFGVKPLYYFSAPGLFLFASEIKAILEHPAVHREPNLNYLQDYVQYGQNEYGKETAFKHIFHFDFSCYFLGSINAVLQPDKIILKKFWSFTPNLSEEVLDEKKLADYTQHYYTLLEDAVKIRLRADVKVGVNLSGGIDSSSIVYLMHILGQRTPFFKSLETFSSVYKTPGASDCDESLNINKLIQWLSIHSHQVEPPVEEIPYEHRKMIYHLDTPPDSTLMSTWYTAKLIHTANTHVTIKGDGADEQLAGYLRYVAYYFASMHWRDVFTQYRLFRDFSGVRPYMRIGLLANAVKTLFGKRVAEYLYAKTGRKEKIFTPVNKKLKEDLFGILVNFHHVNERIFMAFSVEHRAPFMDYRLVEFLASIPVAYKLARGETKYLARKAFDNILPTSINWSKNKFGWPIPERFWFEGKLKTWLQTVIENSTFLKQQQFFLIRNPHKTSLTCKIRLLNIAVWYEVFFNSDHAFDISHRIIGENYNGD